MYKIRLENQDGFCGIEYNSPKNLENAINTEADFEDYFYSLYRCHSFDESPFNERRDSIKKNYPDLVIDLGKKYILTGIAAYEIISTYYYSLSLIEDFNEDEVNYYLRRFDEVKSMHNKSQSLPVPINLTEGQLGTDDKIDFFVREAVINKLIKVYIEK